MIRRTIWLVATLFAVGLMLGLLLLLPRIIGEVTYPLAYEDLIVRYSTERELDPYLVAAVIYSESRYRPTAVSPVGARGLMQIMPATAQGIARKMGDTDFRTNDLFNPETSINFGTFHLQGLAGRYRSNVDGVLAGYNGGGAVGDRYLAGQGGIPFETQRYVVNVKAARDKYKELYADRLNPVKSTPLSVPTGTSVTPSLASKIITSVVSVLQGQ